MEPLDHNLAGEVFGMHVTEWLEILNPAFSAAPIFEARDMKLSEEFNPVADTVGVLTSFQHLCIIRAREAASTETIPFILGLV
jgi:hypothetical protein